MYYSITLSRAVGVIPIAHIKLVFYSFRDIFSHLTLQTLDATFHTMYGI